MTHSLVDTLAEVLTAKLGVKVVVHRDKIGNTTQYRVGVDRCHPGVFGPMNVDQCKRSLAMISDMLSSGVLSAPHKEKPSA